MNGASGPPVLGCGSGLLTHPGSCATTTNLSTSSTTGPRPLNSPILAGIHVCIATHRLRRCYEPAQKYVLLFGNAYHAVIARFAHTRFDWLHSPHGRFWRRFLVFVFGGLFLLFLGFSFVFDDELLLADFFMGRSVGWWFAAVGMDTCTVYICMHTYIYTYMQADMHTYIYTNGYSHCLVLVQG